MITSMASFLDYFEGVRKRTLSFLRRIPPNQMNFTPHPGKFTLGDLIRHLASVEAMYARALLGGDWTYEGHGPEHGATLEEALAYLDRQHRLAVAQLQAAPDGILETKRPTLHGYPVRVWHLLMAMAEHEVHHRSQVSQYLVALGLEAPQVFGLKIEEVAQES
ncbi:MAG: DinB family protein [Symbiobacteriia bacterium]